MPMKTADRDKYLREIAAELRRIRDIPIRQMPDDALHSLTYARNFLRSIRTQ